MKDSYTHPKIRWPLDIQTQVIDGKEVLILKCPIGVSEEPLCLVSGVGPILARFDGGSSVQEIANQLVDQKVPLNLISELVKLLDEHLFLESPKYFAAESETRRLFKDSTVREAALAGRGYSNNKAELAGLINGYLAGDSLTSLQAKPGKLLGIISPHIDYQRGGESYGKTFPALKSEQHDLYVVIGTSHQWSKGLFHLTTKDFKTPLGLCKCDKPFVEKLASDFGIKKSFADEILHRREHSLELQLPFLQQVVTDPKIAPILVGSFHGMLSSGRLPNEVEEYDHFVNCLVSAIRGKMDAGENVCFVAGIDMAHIGSSFGDLGKLTREQLEETRVRDKVYLDAIANQDKEALFAHIVEDSDARRICGYPTMYTLIDLFDRLGLKYRMELFDYDQAVDFESDCAVSFAGAGLYI